MRISDWSSDVCSSDLGSARWAERRSEAAGAAPAYIYRFDFATPVLDGAIGAAHGGDIPFAMANYTASSMAGDRPENPAIAKIMSDTWVNFSATSQPRSEERSVGKECVITVKSWW